MVFSIGEVRCQNQAFVAEISSRVMILSTVVFKSSTVNVSVPRQSKVMLIKRSYIAIYAKSLI